MLKQHLEKLADSWTARSVLGGMLVVAGVMLGASWQAANTVATDQAASVSAACDRSATVARELAADGTCEQARDVVASPVIGPAGPDGEDGAPGATGTPGTPGTDGVGVPGTPGRDGAAGRPGTTGPAGVAGTAGRDGSSITGPAGATGRTGATGPRGPAGPVGERGPAGATGRDGANGAAGPSCPDGTGLQPVTFASGEQGLGCVSGGSSGG